MPIKLPHTASACRGKSTPPVYNFSGGPGELPAAVLAAAGQAIIEVPEAGLSVLGISHRSDWFRAVVTEAVANLRRLLNIPANYHVLFLQGGSSLQFSMIPMNFLRHRERAADYIVSGYWSAKSVTEARREGQVNVAWDGAAQQYTRLPEPGELQLTQHATYLHYISNETVEGLQFKYIPGPTDVPRICDMSSDFLAQPFDINQYALIYAHAQKNLGPSGVTVVILQDALLADVPKDLPSMLDYRVHIAQSSIYNTPPVFSIYVVLLVTRWLLNEVGGLDAMQNINAQKAQRLYECIDAGGGFYRCRAARTDRSAMNAVFHLPTPELEQSFLQAAQTEGFYGLEGHRAVGGIRASLYNAVSLEAVAALCAFMENFRQRYG
ncbi:MAG: phosphoserine transaminase [Methylococcaceae bacterium]|nr:MAG: phosphoserine transaminase [Methylococcaceae bacterium]